MGQHRCRTVLQTLDIRQWGPVFPQRQEANEGSPTTVQVNAWRKLARGSAVREHTQSVVFTLNWRDGAGSLGGPTWLDFLGSVPKKRDLHRENSVENRRGIPPEYSTKNMCTSWACRKNYLKGTKRIVTK